MVTANWQWWTYIKVGDYIASHACILELNFAAGRVRYQKVINFPKDRIFDRGEFEGPFDEIWVDPARSLAHPREVIEAMDRGVVPATFVRLMDQDPRDYFKNEQRILSTYLPTSDAPNQNQ